MSFSPSQTPTSFDMFASGAGPAGAVAGAGAGAGAAAAGVPGAGAAGATAVGSGGAVAPAILPGTGGGGPCSHSRCFRFTATTGTLVVSGLISLLAKSTRANFFTS